jgi:outer membrane scaffolding protein for murein synthesis (MipA/OmpV family)
VTHSIQARAHGPRLTPGSRFRARLGSGCLLALLLIERAFGQTADPVTTDTVEDVVVSARTQTTLEAETISVSATPDAEPYPGGVTAIAGLGALISPVYEGSKTVKAKPFPYVDVHGLFDDRFYLSSVRGIGVNLLNTGPFRGGFAINYAGGRTSKDSERLRGLPDLSGGAVLGGFMTYSFRPFAVEAQVRHKFGSSAGTQASLGMSLSAAPLPRFHLSLGADLTWANSQYQRTNFGVTAAEAAQATAAGNPMSAYTPGSGLLDFNVTAVALYQMSKHWGLIGRIGLADLVGSPAKDSPLTQRTFQPSVAFGALYKF